jgi:O-antigen/teichoic acid export membrane protein
VSISRNTTYNFIGAIIPIGLALVTVPVYLKLIGPDRYGVLSIAWLLLGYFGLFDLGLGRATAQRLAALVDATPKERADTFWTALVINALMGLVGAAILWPAAYYFFAFHFKVIESLRPEILESVPLLAISVPFATSIGVMSYTLIGRQRFFEANTVAVTATSLLQILPLIVALTWTIDLRILLTSALLGRVATLALLWYHCRNEGIAREPFHFDSSQVRELLHYGGWVTVSSFFGPFLSMLDRFAIGAMIGARAVTIYTVPSQIAQRISIIPNALGNALFPRLSAATTEQREAMSARATAALAAIITPAAVAGIVVMRPFLTLWVGHDLAGQAWPVGCLVVGAYWFNAFAQIAFTELQARGRPDLVSKTLIAEIPFYLVALYCGLRFGGFEGAAIAFVFRNALDYFLLSFVAFKRLQKPALLIYCFALVAAAPRTPFGRPRAQQDDPRSRRPQVRQLPQARIRLSGHGVLINRDPDAREQDIAGR